jgi:hypothetical protein
MWVEEILCWVLENSNLHRWGVHVEVKLTLKLYFDQELIGQSILRFSSYVAPSVTSGPVCNFLVQVLLGLASAINFGSMSSRARDHISFETGFLSVTSYDSHPYGGSIVACLHVGRKPCHVTTGK